MSAPLGLDCDFVHAEAVILAIATTTSVVEIDGAPALYAQIDGWLYQFAPSGDGWVLRHAAPNAPAVPPSGSGSGAG